MAIIIKEDVPSESDIYITREELNNYLQEYRDFISYNTNGIGFEDFVRNKIKVAKEITIDKLKGY